MGLGIETRILGRLVAESRANARFGSCKWPVMRTARYLGRGAVVLAQSHGSGPAQRVHGAPGLRRRSSAGMDGLERRERRRGKSPLVSGKS